MPGFDQTSANSLLKSVLADANELADCKSDATSNPAPNTSLDGVKESNDAPKEANAGSADISVDVSED